MTYSIRQTRADDVLLLGAIEDSAAALFRTIPELAWIADDAGGVSRVEHLTYVAAGTSWVAEENEARVVGFLCAEPVADCLHIWEVAVLPHVQQRGMGRALVETAITFARARSLQSVTLTTFRSVPWNEHFYQKLGFETLGEINLNERLVAILDREIERGLPGAGRCAMRKTLGLAAP